MICVLSELYAKTSNDSASSMQGSIFIFSEVEYFDVLKNETSKVLVAVRN